MSVWYCSEHGLTGPMGCCGKATLARIAPNTPAPSVYFEHPATGAVPTPIVPLRGDGGTVVDVSNLHTLNDPRDAELARLRSEVHRLEGEREANRRLATAARAWFDAWTANKARLSPSGAVTILPEFRAFLQELIVDHDTRDQMQRLMYGDPEAPEPRGVITTRPTPQDTTTKQDQTTDANDAYLRNTVPDNALEAVEGKHSSTPQDTTTEEAR